MGILDMTVLELGKRIQPGNITAVQATEASLARTKAVEPFIHVYVTMNEEEIMEQAGKVQAEIEARRFSEPLAGIPVAIRDNVCTEGVRTTCSSRTLESFIPAYTAQAVANLKQTGAVILGRTNMDEFAMGSTTETSAFGATGSSWNSEHAPGRSSGSSCAVVTAGEYFCTLGSDTGGSIRQPSSFCDVTGIKPTYGTMSRYGSIAYSSPLNQIGPVTKDVSDCTAVLEVLASHDPKDSISMEWSNCDFTATLSEGIRGMRIGILESYLGQGLDQGVKDAVLEAVRVLEEKRAIAETFDLKLVEHIIPAYYTIVSTEANSNLSRFDGVRYGYWTSEYEGLRSMYEKSRSRGLGSEVKHRITLGSLVLSPGYYDVYYLKAPRTKALIRKEFDRAFASYDIILTPTALATAPQLDQSFGDSLKMYLGDIYTTSVNLAGLPGISLPCGLDLRGFPIGLQLIRDYFEEESIIRATCVYEKAWEWKLLSVAVGMLEELSGVTAGEAERRMSRE